MDIDKMLSERKKLHGDFEITGTCANKIKEALAEGIKKSGKEMVPYKKHAIEMIALKLARIACGKSHHEDHWVDIEGYARLGYKTDWVDLDKAAKEFAAQIAQSE